MSEAKKRVIFLKQSGERLSGGGLGWDPDRVMTTCAKIAHVYKESAKLGVGGIVLVSGSGNMIRGDNLKKNGIATERADMLGRMATIVNAVIVDETLKSLNVP